MEPRFNEPLFNAVLEITNDILCPGLVPAKVTVKKSAASGDEIENAPKNDRVTVVA